jgi:hypothetical protein
MNRSARSTLLAPVLAAALALGLSACDDGATQAGVAPAGPPPTLTGPITVGLRGHALWDSWFDLGELGYEEAEYFISGTARSADGASTAPYTTRFILRRPRDAADFNGTVVLDWVNVTAQFENSVDTLYSQELFLREGYAYVHVSAQAAGLCCLPDLTPQAWDPVRYADLDHPGDVYAFDMFNQIARALREPGAVDAMAGLPVRQVLATGHSQSGNQLFEMLAGNHVDTRVIDGVLVHGSVGKVFQSNPPVPTIQVLSDWEARVEGPPPGLANLRLWEVAGTAHSDFHVGYQQVIGQGPRALASLPQRSAQAYFDLLQTSGNYGEQPHPMHAVCVLAGASAPTRYVMNAAFEHLRRWAAGGTPPPQPPRFEFDAQGAQALDRFGHSRGGIRLPPVDLPVARYRTTLCELGGITVPMTTLELGNEYGSHRAYACAMQAAIARTVDEGYLLPVDAEDLLRRVEGARNRFLVGGGETCS